VTNGQAEFYLREAPPDPDRTTPIVKSSRPGESGPEVELLLATVKGNQRQLESIKTLFGEHLEEKRIQSRSNDGKLRLPSFASQ